MLNDLKYVWKLYKLRKDVKLKLLNESWVRRQQWARLGARTGAGACLTSPQPSAQPRSASDLSQKWAAVGVEPQRQEELQPGQGNSWCNSVWLVRMRDIPTVRSLRRARNRDCFRLLETASASYNSECPLSGKRLRSSSPSQYNRSYSGFAQIEKEMLAFQSESEEFIGGSTAIVCMVAGNYVFTANLGDSRATLV